MIDSRFFYTCLVFLSLSACDTQKLNSAVNKPVEIKGAKIVAPSITVPDKVTVEPQVTTKPLNLSIDKTYLYYQKNNEGMLINNNSPAEANSALYNKLIQKPAESDISISGQLLTDKNADKATDYLKTVEGLQINIEGRFN